MSTVIELPKTTLATEADSPQASKDHLSSPSSTPSQKQDTFTTSPAVELISGQRYNRPYMKVKVSVKTNAANQIIMYNFRRLNESLASASGFISRFGSDDEVKGLFKLINDIFEKREQEIAQAYKGARALLTSKGLDGTRADYSSMHVLEVPYNSPLALRYLQIVQDLDEFLVLIDTCWLSGVITEGEYKKFLADWQKRLTDVSQTLFREQQRIVEVINERRKAERNAEKTEQPAGDGSDKDPVAADSIDADRGDKDEVTATNEAV